MSSYQCGCLVETEEAFCIWIEKVHAGILLDNTRVVIKVQHLGMKKVMAADLRNIGWV